MKVPIIKINIDDEVINDVVEVLKSGIWAESSNVHALEHEFAEYIAVKHARAVNNGTAALICALHAIGIRKGDEVLVPSFTFIASVNSILYFGAKPVFVDINQDTFNLDVNDLEKKIGEKTRAIMPVHLYGLSSDMDPINEIANAYDLKVIEDACQAHGAEYKGKKCGALGHVAAFSLYPTKNMPCGGEGGMITTNDEKIFNEAKLYSNHGQSEKYIHSSIGFNFRMQETNAVVARYALKKLDSDNQKRRKNARLYDELLSDVKEVTPPAVPKGYHHVYHQYTIKVERRDQLAEHLRENQVGFGIHYGIPVHQQQSIKNLGYSMRLPVTERIAREVLSLPIHPNLNDDQIHFVVSTIKEFFS
ncbi:MAG: DegT/DnrJ/EryC1/StrS family aminotransferase [Promethearchaeota archaeon]